MLQVEYNLTNIFFNPTNMKIMSFQLAILPYQFKRIHLHFSWHEIHFNEFLNMEIMLWKVILIKSCLKVMLQTGTLFIFVKSGRGQMSICSSPRLQPCFQPLLTVALLYGLLEEHKAHQSLFRIGGYVGRWEIDGKFHKKQYKKVTAGKGWK